MVNIPLIPMGIRHGIHRSTLFWRQQKDWLRGHHPPEKRMNMVKHPFFISHALESSN